MKSIIALLFIFFSASVFSQDIDALKKELDTLQTLFTNETLTSEQYSEAVEKLIAGELEEYASLKKMLDDGILDLSQFWGAINKILGYDQGETSSSTSTDETVNSNEESEEKTVSNENSISSSDDKPSKNENELLSDAIGNIQSINSDVPTKDRLTLYENAIDNVAKIEKFYAGTDTALKLKTNQNIGDFSITKIRENYLNEVLSFYDIVCEKSPSYLCLGFVSLKTGKDMCKNSSSIEDLNSAHNNLLNSVKIFKGQESKSAYSNISLSTHRNCKKDIQGVDEDFSKGYFAMPLVKTLLDIGDDQVVRGIIENLNDPYFKLQSVLYFKEASSEIADVKYYKRIKQFINEKLDDKNNNNTLTNNLAKIALFNLMINNGEGNFKWSGQWEDDDKGVIDQIGSAFYGVKKLDDPAYACDGFVTSYVHEKLINLMFDFYDSEVSRYDDNTYNYWGNILFHLNKKLWNNYPLWENCEKPNYNLINKLISDLLYFRGKDDALKFSNFIFNSENLDSEVIFDKFLELFFSDKNLELVFVTPDNASKAISGNSTFYEVFSQYLQEENDDYTRDGILEDQINNIKEYGKISYIEYLVNQKDTFFTKDFKLGDFGQYRVFQKYVEYNDVCKSSQILFQKLKNTAYYDEAINYMVESPNIDPTTKYECGDEDLELLLN